MPSFDIQSSSAPSSPGARYPPSNGHVGGITSEGLMVDAGGVQPSVWDLRRALQEGAAYPSSSGGGTTLPSVDAAPYTMLG